MSGTRLMTFTLALLPVLFASSACGSTTTSQDTRVSSDISVPAPPVGTIGALIPIDSDNVAMAGYDSASQVMTVLFDSGGLYEYYDVPIGLWENFRQAQPDPWSKVGYPQLVQGGYAYREITP